MKLWCACYVCVMGEEPRGGVKCPSIVSSPTPLFASFLLSLSLLIPLLISKASGNINFKWKWSEIFFGGILFAIIYGILLSLSLFNVLLPHSLFNFCYEATLLPFTPVLSGRFTRFYTLENSVILLCLLIIIIIIDFRFKLRRNNCMVHKILYFILFYFIWSNLRMVY